jgi:hypothetical protein
MFDWHHLKDVLFNKSESVKWNKEEKNSCEVLVQHLCKVTEITTSNMYWFYYSWAPDINKRLLKGSLLIYIYLYTSLLCS